MNPPLLEVNLDLEFRPLQYSAERLQFFGRENSKWLTQAPTLDGDSVACFATSGGKGLLTLGPESLQLKSTEGVSFARLRPGWMALVKSVQDVFEIPVCTQVSMSYFNQIPIVDLRSFRNYLNICFEMPSPLAERIEFFRTEFTYKFPFGDVHLWVQPDWEEKFENYCIQLSIEARAADPVAAPQLEGVLQKMHEGIKEVFHQVLSRDYISRLPQ